MALTRLNNRSVSAVTALPSGIDIPAGTIVKADLPSGTVLQVVQQESATMVTTTSSLPQTLVSATITPISSSNKVLILATVGEPDQGDGRIWARIFRNDTSTQVFQINAEVGRGLPTGAEVHLPALSQYSIDSPSASNSPVTYLLTVQSQTGGTIRVGNGSKHRLILMEIAG